jgi:hypothetical protein
MHKLEVPIISEELARQDNDLAVAREFMLRIQQEYGQEAVRANARFTTCNRLMDICTLDTQWMMLSAQALGIPSSLFEGIAKALRLYDLHAQ